MARMPARIGTIAKPISRSGRRPRFSEWKPTHGRQERDHDLRRHDQAGHPQRRSVRVRFRQVLADQRQHRSVGKLEEHQRAGEEDEPAVLRQIERAREVHCLLSGDGVARLGVVDLLAADGAERDQRRNAQRRGREEDGAIRQIGAGERPSSRR